MTRQSVSRPATTIPAPKPRSGRDRSWERSHPTASFRIPAELRDEITAIAQERDLSTSEIARALLEHSLQAYKVGDLVLTPTFRGRLTLFPDDP